MPRGTYKWKCLQFLFKEKYAITTLYAFLKITAGRIWEVQKKMGKAESGVKVVQ